MKLQMETKLNYLAPFEGVLVLTAAITVVVDGDDIGLQR
jgi:hypothetical protein